MSGGMAESGSGPAEPAAAAPGSVAGRGAAARPGEVPREVSHSPVVDVLGIAVLAGLAVWALTTAAGRDARPEGILLTLLAVVSGYAFGRVAGALLPGAAAAFPALAVAVVAAVVPGALSGEPLAPPLRYGNANGALLSLATGLACVAAVAFGRGVRRVLMLGLAAVLVGFAVASGSAAAAVTSVGTLLVALAAMRLRRRGLVLVALAAVPGLVVGGTVLLAVTDAGDRLPESVAAQITEERVALWRDAVRLVGEHPGTGIGPDRFEEASAEAAADPDLAKPHSAPLQLAAEQGIPGAVLLALAFTWTMVALARSGRPTPLVLTAATALCGLGTHAAVDYVLSFPPVVGAAGLLLGVATARPVAEERGEL